MPGFRIYSIQNLYDLTIGINLNNPAAGNTA